MRPEEVFLRYSSVAVSRSRVEPAQLKEAMDIAGAPPPGGKAWDRKRWDVALKQVQAKLGPAAKQNGDWLYWYGKEAVSCYELGMLKGTEKPIVVATVQLGKGMCP